ncbi:YbaB/EbfC family nucleoid-associated protein [Nocardia sp. NPDC051756]|uniref:YbaB/EbfC family nucleoid-associated protein n=1 Tax=Nocardia sp. NPDC051756 TaxID=3154751 RepID=UPI00343D06E6
MTDFADLEATVRAQLNRMQQLSDDLAAIRVAHATDDDTITVVVDGTARILDIQLSEGISRMSPVDFGQAVVVAAAAAAQQALALRGRLIEEFNN